MQGQREMCEPVYKSLKVAGQVVRVGHYPRI